MLRSAVEHSLPVYIELPRDQVAAEVAAIPVLPRRHADPGALVECVDEILARFAAAIRPVLMVDVEVRRYGVEQKVAKLAERLGVPLVTSFMGRGLLADHPSLVCGTYLGAAGKREITDLVERADWLLLLGVIVSDTNLAVSKTKIDLRSTMLAIGRKVRIGHHTYPDLPIDELVDALLDRAPARAVPANLSAAPRLGVLPRQIGDDARLAPSDIAACVNDLFGRHGSMPIAADMGDCLFTAMEIANTALVAPGYYAGMGYGVPGGLGLCVASRGRTMILVGDGAFQMTGFELGNCRRYGWDPIIIVFNNTRWEMLRVFQPESRFNDLDDWRFAELAPVLGGDGVRVHTKEELAAALERAVKTRGRFQLIEAMLPRGTTSETLTRFVAGFKEAGERPRVSWEQANIAVGHGRNTVV